MMGKLSGSTYREAARDIPVHEPVDVLVAGAGAAGIVAAIAAARAGASTLLVDPFATPGGTSIIGLSWTRFHDGQKLVVRGIAEELMCRMVAIGGMYPTWTSDDWVSYDVEKWKTVSLEALLNSGVRLLLHTSVAGAILEDDGHRLAGVIVHNKAGRSAIPARCTIDATGDADVAFAAGVPCQKGRARDSKMQPMSLVFTLGGVDIARWHEAGGYELFASRYAEVAEREGFINPRRGGKIPGPQTIPGRPNELSLNVTRICGIDGSDPVQLTRGEVEGRQQVTEFVEKFLRPHLPGFEHCYVVQTPQKIGVRETRRIVGQYVMAEQDITEYRVPEDTIGRHSYPIDVHEPSGEGTDFRWDQQTSGRSYGVSYRCLVPLKVDRLLAAGRCLSATHEAASSARVMPCCMVMGQAAGAAAAMALDAGVDVRSLDVRALQRKLLRDGAYLGPEIDRLLEQDGAAGPGRAVATDNAA